MGSNGFTLYRLGKIKNKWITDALSEILSTFILAVSIVDIKSVVENNIWNRVLVK